ncbi:hypothetical protein GF373_14290 [bacterium]|nr:hypothetical protein [bacterium]
MSGYRRIVFGFFGIVLFFVGCLAPELEQPTSHLLDEHGNFTLFVSNQSAAITPVDITIHIDGEMVVNDYFPVKNYHFRKKYKLDLPAGSHVIHAKTLRGGVEMEKEFHVEGKRWALVGYSYAKHTRHPYPRNLSFTIQNEPILFH